MARLIARPRMSGRRYRPPPLVRERVHKPTKLSASIGDRIKATGADPTKEYTFRYRVVPLESLVASHTPTMAVNPAYPKEIQPRLRDREASRQQVLRIASKLEPKALLHDIGTLDRGPMIVGPDLVVESGNGRTIALQVSRLDFPEQWKEYQKALKPYLREYGISPKAMEDVRYPVLVRERLTDVDRVKFAAMANQVTTLAMSPLEQALQDSKRLSDTVVAGLVIKDTQSIDQALIAPQNKPLITAFFKELPENEQAALQGARGELNVTGLQRVKAALFAKVYPGEAGQRLTQAFFESLDPTVKTIENALFDSLPQMAKSESLIRSEQRGQDLTLANDISQTVDLYARLKQEGIPVEHYLRQASFVERDLTLDQERLLAYFDAAGRSRKMMREFLQDYAEAVVASPHPQQGSLMPTATESKAEMLERLTEKRIKEAKGETIGLFGLAAERERAGFKAAQTPPPKAEPPKPAPIPDRPQLERRRRREPTKTADKPANGEAERLEAQQPAPQTPLGKKIDQNIKAGRVVPARLKTEEDKRLHKQWLKRPNQLDKEGVDTPKR